MWKPPLSLRPLSVFRRGVPEVALVGVSQLAKVPRTVGIAAGQRKVSAMRNALGAGLISVLVTDMPTAETILALS